MTFVGPTSSKILQKPVDRKKKMKQDQEMETQAKYLKQTRQLLKKMLQTKTKTTKRMSMLLQITYKHNSNQKKTSPTKKRWT